MLKVAVVQRFLPSRSRGGVGHFTHGLCNALARRGHQVTVFSEDPAPDGAMYQVTMMPSAEGWRGRVSPLIFPWRVAQIDFSGFDVLHAQGDDQLVPRKNTPPIVRTLHGSELSEAIHNGLRQGSMKRFLLHLYFYSQELVAAARADLVVGVSNDTSRFHPRLDAVAPNGVDLDALRDGGEPKTAHPVVLFVGDLESRKRGRLLVDVFEEQVRPAVPEAELWMVCPEHVSAPGVRWFAGLTDEQLARLYRRAWVFCLPSSYEGFGRPYVEAMAAGTPVVATPNAGAREVLEGGRHGVIVREDGLGSTLIDMLRRPELRERYATAGRARAEQYAWDRVAQQYERVYETARARRT